MKRQEGDVTDVGTILSERPAFDNPFFRVIERVVKTPDGEVRDPQLLWDRQSKQFAVVVAVTPEGKIVLVQEPKYGQMRRMVTAVAGGVKKGETPQQAAERELYEETGYRDARWVSLRDQPIVDFADKIDGGGHSLFLALNARPEGTPENLREVVRVDLKQAWYMLYDTKKALYQIDIAISWVALALALERIKR